MAGHLTLAKLLRFGLVGAAATLLHYLIAAALLWGAGLAPALASGIGFAASAVGNYAANARFTFGARGGHGRSLPRFALVAASGCLLNSAVMLALQGRQPVVLAQLLATALVLLWNFLLNALWSFRVNADSQIPEP